MWEELEGMVERGDVAALVASLERLDEAERKRLSARAKKLKKELENRVFGQVGAGWRWDDYGPRLAAADALTFGTGGPAAAARAGWFNWEEDQGLRARVVRMRPREWRQEWAERAMSQESTVLPTWNVVHALVKAGEIDRPAAAGYVTGAVFGMYEWAPVVHGRPPAMARRLADVLREDERDWLEHDVWRLFEVEESGLTTRATWDVADEQTWADALCELAADGTLDRGRLLDASLRALRSDFSPHHARWHHKFHEALEPTPDEHEARLDELLALLASTDPAVVGFALRALAKLEKAGQLWARRYLEAAGHALLNPRKTQAVNAVKLAGRLVKREPDVAATAAAALVDALAHEAREVQEAALAVLERTGLGPERERAEGFLGAVDAALKERLAALTGVERAAAPSGPAVEVPPARRLRRDAPRLAFAEALRPVEDPDELLDRAAVALERADDPDELELVLDGVSRLRAETVGAGRREALMARALALGAGGPLRNARDPLAALLLAWLGGEPARLDTVGETPLEAIAPRMRELLADLSGPPRALLATPTHAGGWIDPAVAVKRVEDAGERPLVLDLAQMVLRLAPDGREDARAAAQRLAGEPAQVLVRALGGDARRPRTTKLEAAWAAAAEASDPDGYDVGQIELPEGLDYSTAWTDVRVGDGGGRSPASFLVASRAWWALEPSQLERWFARVWPANREGMYVLAVRMQWLGDLGGLHGVGELLEPLLDPHEPVGEYAGLALALAVGSDQVQVRALAADILIAALGERRLDGPTLGGQLARLLRENPRISPSRWGAVLGDVAGAGPLHAHDVQAALEVALAAAGEADRRKLLAVTELLRRLAVEADAAVREPAAREWLAAITGSSKIARAAREALAVTGDGAARSRAAAERARAPQRAPAAS